MKTMKKLFALLLALTMVFGLAATAFATMPDTDTDGDNSGTGALNKGSITINDAIKDQSYTAYKIFDLESFNDENESYAYKYDSAWANFFKAPVYDDDGTTLLEEAGDGYSYVNIDANDYVTWKTGDAAEFAKEAVKFAKANGITPISPTSVSADGKKVEFKNLALGYYVVDSSTGALCSLDTTHLDVEMFEKNDVPNVEKKVSNTPFTDAEKPEDWEGNWYNNGSIGDTVYFQTTVHAFDGGQNYVLHDKMSQGLTLLPGTDNANFTVYLVTYGADNAQTWAEIAPMNGTTKQYDVVVPGTEATDECDFEVKFDNDYVASVGNSLTAGSDKTGSSVKFDFVVEYAAKINKDCAQGSNPNTNETWVGYGDGSNSNHDFTYTYVYELNVLKFTGSGANEKYLSDAEFYVYRLSSETVGENTTHYAEFLIAPENTASPNYKVTGWSAKVPVTLTGPAGAQYIDWSAGKAPIVPEGVNTFVTDSNGHIFIDGIGAGDYWFHEADAPEGYNVLDKDISAKISLTVTEGNPPVAVWSTVGATTIDQTTNKAPTTDSKATDVIEAVKIENNSGTLLPSTGGMGTTLFYVFGSILMLGAAVLLIAKKRTNI